MSSTLAPEAPYVFTQKGTFPAPFEYDVPASLEIRPDAATALFDGTGASGNWLAALAFYDNDGNLLGRTFDPTVLKPGDVAEVTYIPPFGSAASAAAAAGLAYEELTSVGVTVAAGTFGEPPFTHSSGSALTNLGVPTNPKLLAAGVYLLALGVTSIGVPVAAPHFARTLIGNPAGIATGGITLEGGAGGGSFAGTTSTFAGLLPANQGIGVTIANDSPAGMLAFTIDFYTIVKLI